jgi:hypothetical protein
MITLCKPSHQAKAYPPIVSTELEISMFVNPVQKLKEDFPMLVTEFPIITLVSEDP